MNDKLECLTEPELRNLLIEQSKKFNTAIRFGTTHSDLEEIQLHIREIEKLLIKKESGNNPQPIISSVDPAAELKR